MFIHLGFKASYAVKGCLNSRYSNLYIYIYIYTQDTIEKFEES